MTTDEIIQYYADLLIMQYKGLTRASATIKALVKMPIMDQLPLAAQNAFDLDTAIGSQLDTLGMYAGVTRYGYGPNGPITLDDDDFRSFVKVAIVRNSSGSSLADIQNLLHTFFDGQLFVVDYANMRLSYLIDSDVGSLDLVYMFVSQDLLPKPMGVQLAAIIYLPSFDNLFGFVSYEVPTQTNTSPFNDYLDYQEDWPWLDYADAIVI